MADNKTSNTSGQIPDTTWATEEIGAVNHPLVKLEYGGVDEAIAVSEANPLPVKPRQIATSSATDRFQAPVIASATAGNVLTADAGRVSVHLQNNGASDAYLGFGRVAQTGRGFVLKANAANEFYSDVFTGSISAGHVGASGTVDILITEFSTS